MIIIYSFTYCGSELNQLISKRSVEMEIGIDRGRAGNYSEWFTPRSYENINYLCKLYINTSTPSSVVIFSSLCETQRNRAQYGYYTASNYKLFYVLEVQSRSTAA